MGAIMVPNLGIWVTFSEQANAGVACQGTEVRAMKAKRLRGRRRLDPAGPIDQAEFVVDWQDGPEGGPADARTSVRTEPVLPVTPAEQRPGAVRSLEMVNIVSVTFGTLGPYLGVVAWVANVAFEKEVWLDLYGFNAKGDLVDRKQLPLRYQAPAGGGGDLFGVHGLVGPNVAALAFRIYYEVNASRFTDGRLHTAATQRG